MSTGLLALLDDVAGLAKVAAASLDDVAGQAARASVKAAGVVVDDAAVAPRFVAGFAAERELPIVGRIAMGSLRNKLLFLLPAALALDAAAPWAVVPLLTLGGAFLCYEGAHKVLDLVRPHAGHAAVPSEASEGAQAGAALEEARVSGAIRTDLVLSAEIMAIALSAVPDGGLAGKAASLAAVAVLITVGVYGAVALIVKADDVGLYLARRRARTRIAAFGRALGRGLVTGMPAVLAFLAAVGTAAMAWVGGGLVAHGLEVHGLALPAHAIHAASGAADDALPSMAGVPGWLVGALCSGAFGLAVGAVLVPAAHRGVAGLRAGRALFSGRA